MITYLETRSTFEGRPGRPFVVVVLIGDRDDVVVGEITVDVDDHHRHAGRIQPDAVVAVTRDGRFFCTTCGSRNCKHVWSALRMWADALHKMAGTVISSEYLEWLSRLPT